MFNYGCCGRNCENCRWYGNLCPGRNQVQQRDSRMYTAPDYRNSGEVRNDCGCNRNMVEKPMSDCGYKKVTVEKPLSDCGCQKVVAEKSMSDCGCQKMTAEKPVNDCGCGEKSYRPYDEFRDENGRIRSLGRGRR